MGALLPLWPRHCRKLSRSASFDCRDGRRQVAGLVCGSHDHDTTVETGIGNQLGIDSHIIRLARLETRVKNPVLTAFLECASLAVDASGPWRILASSGSLLAVMRTLEWRSAACYALGELPFFTPYTLSDTNDVALRYDLSALGTASLTRRQKVLIGYSEEVGRNFGFEYPHQGWLHEFIFIRYVQAYHFLPVRNLRYFLNILFR